MAFRLEFEPQGPNLSLGAGIWASSLEFKPRRGRRETQGKGGREGEDGEISREKDKEEEKRQSVGRR